MAVVNVLKWLEENKSQFHPPVCNKMLSDDYIKIMFVGGPNSRKDYHLDQGEEFFFMLKGDMLLKVMEKGEPKDIHIQEGEVFRLPSRIPHSPQRFENTLGLVIERRREGEFDGLRYYCEDGKTVLWQQFFELKSLVVDLPLVFTAYHNSEQFKSGKPIPGTTGNEHGDVPGKFVADKSTILDNPFQLDPWINRHFKEIQEKGKALFDIGELHVFVYGEGKHNFNEKYESWYWHRKGNAKLEFGGTSSACGEGDAVIVPAMVDGILEIEKEGYGMFISIDALGNLPQE